MLCCCFSFKLNTKAFIRSIYYNICKLFLKIFLRKFIIWERKGNFKLAKVLNLYPTHNHMIRKSNQNLTFQTISKLTKYREREREKTQSIELTANVYNEKYTKYRKTSQARTFFCL